MGSQLKLYVLPGGRLPERKTDGAAGFDAFLRAIVSLTETDPNDSRLRKILFDFQNFPSDPEIARNVRREGNGLVYRLKPGEQIFVGLGFVTEMPFPMFYSIVSRSGLALKSDIALKHQPYTIDSDYRGEAGALVYNTGRASFDLVHDMRIAQVIFQYAVIPELTLVSSLDDLSKTERGSRGFGSTGVLG